MTSAQGYLRTALTAGILALVLTLVGCTYTGPFSDAWSRGQLDIVELFTKAPPNPEWPYLDAVDLTSQVCGVEFECVQAVGNSYLTLYKFANLDDARAYAETLGEAGVQIDPLVINFVDASLSQQHRDEIVYTLSTMNASSGD